MPRAGRAATLLVSGALLLGAAGCGGDEEKAGKTTPTITEPVPSDTVTLTTDTGTDPAAPRTAPTAPRTVTAPPAAPDSGGTTVPAKPNTTPDGPANDTPADPKSPAGRFEKYCDENPGACG